MILIYFSSHSDLSKVKPHKYGHIDCLYFKKQVEFRENVRSFFPQGQCKLSVIMRFPYWAGVCKAQFDHNFFN